MFALIAELTMWGWLAVVALSALLIFGLEVGSGPVSFFGLVVGLLALWVSQAGLYVPYPSEIVHFVGHYWLTGLVYAGYYVAIGVVWSVVKWYFYNLNRRDQFLSDKEGYETSWRSQRTYSQWKDSTYETFLKDQYDFPPQLKKNKARILTWMSYWPWSAAWTVLNDPFRRLFNWLYARLGGVYNAVTNHVFAGVIVDPNK